MARKARKRAESGVYYIRIDSSDKLIFMEDTDRRCFLSLLERTAMDDFAVVYAYCLMAERIDLLVKEGLVGVSSLIQKTLSAYALYYNERYAREGRLFRDRFRSLPVEDADDIMDAARYVHRLPLTFEQPLAYEWSSYRACLKGETGEDLLLLAGGAAAFKDYTSAVSDFVGFDRKHITDADLRVAAREMLEGYTPEALEAISDEEYDALLKKLIRIDGTTLGQLCRVLGLSRRRLERAARED